MKFVALFLGRWLKYTSRGRCRVGYMGEDCMFEFVELIGLEWEHNSSACFPQWVSLNVASMWWALGVLVWPRLIWTRHPVTEFDTLVDSIPARQTQKTLTKRSHQRTLKIKNKCWPFLTSRYIGDSQTERNGGGSPTHTPTCLAHLQAYVIASQREKKRECCACALFLSNRRALDGYYMDMINK